MWFLQNVSRPLRKFSRWKTFFEILPSSKSVRSASPFPVEARIPSFFQAADHSDHGVAGRLRDPPQRHFDLSTCLNRPNPPRIHTCFMILMELYIYIYIVYGVSVLRDSRLQSPQHPPWPKKKLYDPFS